jgi:hypothetical protein
MGQGFRNSEVGMRNAENGKRCKAPTIVTLRSDYGTAGRTHAPTYKNQTFSLFSSTFRIPNSEFKYLGPLALNNYIIVKTLSYKN